ncbi:MAG TPA: hypothetical protein VNX68_04315 [Nitrosopumilaceae archaeon]|jgi:hypothetical protein|nr:hypothetical protein [Nitrosopumilaceae archaeon]
MLFLADLDRPKVRSFMLDEIDLDIKTNVLYISKRFSSVGIRDYPDLIRQAAQQFDDEWLSNELRKKFRINITEQRRFRTATIPSNAPEIIAEGEFNRFYIRGLCRFALENRISELEVYVAKTVETPRPDSVSIIGTRINANDLLNDLRTSIGIVPTLGVPAGPNSEISVKLPEDIQIKRSWIVRIFGQRRVKWLTRLFGQTQTKPMYSRIWSMVKNIFKFRQ